MNDPIKDVEDEFLTVIHDIGCSIHGTEQYASAELTEAAAKIKEAVALMRQHLAENF